MERLRFIGAAMRAGLLMEDLRALISALDLDDAAGVRRECARLVEKVGRRKSSINRLMHDLKRAREQPEMYASK